MDIEGDCVRLGDDDIVKNTQFSSENCSGSQAQAATEPRLVYGSSQDTAAFSHFPYIPFAGTRAPPLQHPQISYSQQNEWPNYGPGYGSAVHPMRLSMGSGMCSPFPSGNFSGMSTPYSGHTQGGAADSFLFSQIGHMPVVPPNMEWMSMRSMGLPTHEPLRVAPVVAEGARNLEPRPLSAREPASSGGPWYCPRSRRRDDDERENMNLNKRQFMSVSDAPSASKNVANHTRPAPPQPSELRQSPPPESAETQQGPIRSGSVGVERTPRASTFRTQNFQEDTPSQGTTGMQRSVDTPSKCNTPQSLMHRKALREDEKTYLKEVKAAIAEGRVPQVTVSQDETGNIVRYKAQFLNALKLAAHAIVKDAYIKIGEQDTMNEIIKEVRRQFIVPQPLPPGMVESFLKGYFKRCRFEYHKFWIKNGDRKKPDGCKEAAWLQLVDFWKSNAGKNECDQNKRNASLGRSDLSKKLQSDGDCSGDVAEVVKAEGAGVAVKNFEVSDSLAFESEEPLSRTRASANVPRNPMADISNQLHKAVDTILSSYERNCGSLPSLALRKEHFRTCAPPTENHGLRSNRAVSRTAAEVIGSLQRPKAAEREIGVSQTCASEAENLSRMSDKVQSAAIDGTADIGVKAKKATLEPKSSIQCSLSKGNYMLPNGKSEVGNIQEHVGAEKECTVLSSDGSSDGVDFRQLPCNTGSRQKDVTSVSRGTYTEEIEGWTVQCPQTGSAIKISMRRPSEDFQEAQIMRQMHPQRTKQLKQKSVLEEEKPSPLRGNQENIKGKSSINAGKTTPEADDDFNGHFQSISDDETEEADAPEEEDDGSSDQEEAPVLPRDVVKRKLDSEYGSTSGKKESKERGTRKMSKAAQKKQKCNQIDASIIKKLDLYKRPKNSNPMKTRTRIWVLHPKFVGKVVAEANAGVNRKSRCVDSANELCKEGQQMIHVVRVLYKNTPVMFDMNSRFPKQISYLDQAEGVPNMPILWCISHLIEIPPVDQITRLLGPYIQPASQETEKTESDFKNSKKKGERNLKHGVPKDGRKGRTSNAGSGGAGAPKEARTVLRSANG